MEIGKLRVEMKERESNRLRATTTLIDEMVAMSKGGPPVSLAAIKGFAASWLFPRTVIVLGSIAGAALLAMQTYIMSQQTKLMTLQSAAAKVEQIEKMRERWFKISALLADNRHLPPGYELPIGHFDCSPDCDAPLEVALSDGHEKATSMAFTYVTTTLDTHGIVAFKSKSAAADQKSGYLVSVVHPMISHCGSPSTHAAKISELLDLLSYSAPLLEPRANLDRRTIQIRLGEIALKDAALYEATSAKAELPSIGKVWNRSKPGSQGHFLSRIASWHMDLSHLSQELVERCTAMSTKIASDIAAMEQ
ncbi:hypothetical protein ASD88_00475 [Pelomonas sp. Root662]|nr:hypothetical protein ASC81_00475 [Pelomonas sp. Root405]KRA77401.1 hypothetical protein ASD88_00475 [Pelomonas sp. Root662]